MKFPLYNECPNCGGLANEHSEYRSDCHCHARRNQPIYGQLNALVGQSGPEVQRQYEELNAQLFWCRCNLTPAEVNNAISIQAAVEVALQKAGVGDFRGLDEDEEIPGGYHSCDGPCCEKRPGEYCKDDDCNCGAAGNHATLPKSEGRIPDPTPRTDKFRTDWG